MAVKTHLRSLASWGSIAEMSSEQPVLLVVIRHFG